jgi:hypothetical protein
MAHGFDQSIRVGEDHSSGFIQHKLTSNTHVLCASPHRGNDGQHRHVNRAVYADDEAVGFIQYYPNHGNGRPDEIFIDQLM